MTKNQAEKRIKQFVSGHDKLTFDIKEYDNQEWVAECNEIPAIATCGQGYDIDYIFDLLEDAILTAAGIPAEHCDGLLKKIWNNDAVKKSKDKSPIAPVRSAYYQVKDLAHA